jgi:D-alanyl-D-alanine carboxypeptidase
MKEKNLSLKIGNNQLVSNNQVIKIMDVAPLLICNRTYLPARWVSEFFNYSVEWDSPTKSVLIFPAGETRPQPPKPVNILLVNKIHGLPENFQPGVLVDFDGYQFSALLQEPLQKLFDSAKEHDISLTVTSGYRSYLRQKQIMDERIEEVGLQEALATVAPLGHSEHQTGLAVDLGGDSDEAYTWLEANCWRYGFILRYPQGQEEITGYSYEPWHFRFLGVPIAAFMHENKVLTLEEFVSSYLGN